MNKQLYIGILGLIAASFIIAQPVFAVITGSPHDFSGESWSGGQICVICHTPHSAVSTISPLWNHAVTAATFQPYSSLSLNAAVGQPGAQSKACLSCHDGTVAINSFGGNTGSEYVTGSDLIGTDLRNDHPVSFLYNAALATSDGGLNDPVTKTVGDLGGKSIKDGMLFADRVECSSCHDVHKTKGYSKNSSKLLLVNNAASGLCLTCHNK